MSERRVRLVLLAATAGALIAGCAAPEPYVRYDGDRWRRAPKPADDMEVFRAGPPPPRYRDLGTVVVTCPSEGAWVPGPFGGHGSTVGGCYYDWAVEKARENAAAAGGDGIHTIESTTNSAGLVVSLRASVFVHLPKLVVPPKPPDKKPEPTVKERLQQLDELKADQLITPEEYDKKRAEILDDI
jgi:hypothetical protein